MNVEKTQRFDIGRISIQANKNYNDKVFKFGKHTVSRSLDETKVNSSRRIVSKVNQHADGAIWSGHYLNW